YFQGYFFSKPVIVSRTDLPSYKLNLILLLKELLRPDLNLEKVERIMQRDVSLSYKLLRFINSAAFGFHTNIRSIKHAITLIGIAEFRKWMSVIVVSQIGSEKPDEVMQQSIVRAKFCELIAEHLKMVKADAFLMGMFSLLDTMVGRPMKELLESLPLTAEIKNALLCVPNNYKCILDLILCYERTRWQHVLELSKKFGLPLDLIPRFYMEAVKWAGSI
ncbi:MAG: HDOD domain-containing protein, partial [bacterium]|nr:HDOD domain-containing protein [bacterium]